MARTRGAWIAAGATAVVLIGGFVAFDQFSGRMLRDVDLPPTAATPSQVVTTFLDALDAHDCDTAQDLATEAYREVAKTWCSDIASLRNAKVLQVNAVNAGDTATGVSVAFDVKWRLFRGDGSTDGSGMTWGYSLVRESRDAPWRIRDHGVG